jgi:hypothetical protein
VLSAFANKLNFSDPVPATLVYVLDLDAMAGATVDTLTACCLEIKACAEHFGTSRATLWLVFKGALASNNAKIDPIATGA